MCRLKSCSRRPSAAGQRPATVPGDSLLRIIGTWAECEEAGRRVLIEQHDVGDHGYRDPSAVDVS